MFCESRAPTVAFSVEVDGIEVLALARCEGRDLPGLPARPAMLGERMLDP
jgi:hypothetical protein